MDATRTLLLVAGAYLVGSIPTGVLVARARGLPDPRGEGSGNIGATNVARSFGAKLGALTLVGDLLKGLAPVLLARALGADGHVLSTVAVAAVAGHMAPVFLGFRGGKGVATGLGVYLGLAPLAALVAVAVFALGFAATRIVSLSSLAASASVPALCLALPQLEWLLPGALLLTAMVAWKHRENLARLRRGEEPRFSFGSRER